LAEALARRDEVDEVAEVTRAAIEEASLGKTLTAAEEESVALSQAIDEFVLTKYDAGDGYEDDGWKLTKVVGHSRVWNAEKLHKLIPYGVFKKVTRVVVDTHKLNEAVKTGEIDLDRVDAAYEITPNAPYVKRTRKSQGGDPEAEAATLAEKLA